MLLAGERQIGAGDALAPHRVKHQLRLVGRDDAVFQPLQQNDGAGQAVGLVDGRPPAIDVRALRVRRHQSVQVSGLELVGVRRQRGQVGNPVVAGAGGEHIAKGQRGQGGVAAGAPAPDCQPPAVGQALMHQIQGGIHAVVHINHAPIPVEQLPVGPSVADAPAIVHINYRKTPAGPELDGQIQRAGGRPGRPAVAHHQQRRQLARRRAIFRVARRIIQAIGRPALIRRKPDALRRGDIAGRDVSG